MSSRTATRPTKHRNLRAVVRDQGRSFVWLARQTGYSPEHVARVANREHPGSQKFHLAMRAALGEEYAA